jgi:hypothetical protein
LSARCAREKEEEWNKREVKGSMGFTTMVARVHQSPWNDELWFGQPGGSLVKLEEGKERGVRGLLIGVGMRRIWQGIGRINAGEKSAGAEVTRVTRARRKKTLTGRTHLSAVEEAGQRNGSGDSPGGPWAESWPWTRVSAPFLFLFSKSFMKFSKWFQIDSNQSLKFSKIHQNKSK